MKFSMTGQEKGDCMGRFDCIYYSTWLYRQIPFKIYKLEPFYYNGYFCRVYIHILMMCKRFGKTCRFM